MEQFGNRICIQRSKNETWLVSFWCFFFLNCVIALAKLLIKYKCAINIARLHFCQLCKSKRKLTTHCHQYCSRIVLPRNYWNMSMEIDAGNARRLRFRIHRRRRYELSCARREEKKPEQTAPLNERHGWLTFNSRKNFSPLSGGGMWEGGQPRARKKLIASPLSLRTRRRAVDN